MVLLFDNKPDRVQRLKDARTEATKEIEALKAQKQAEYAQYEKNVRCDSIVLIIPHVSTL